MNNISIVSAQKVTSQIVPRPTKSDLIDALVREVIEQRTQENKIRAEKRKVVRAKLDKEIEKFRKTKIKLDDLEADWKNATGSVHVRYTTIQGTPEMKRLETEMSKLHDLVVSESMVKEEIQKKMKKEILDSILSQPGIKEAFGSTIAKLGLNE